MKKKKRNKKKEDLNDRVKRRRRSTKRETEKEIEKSKKEIEELERIKRETREKLNKDKKIIEENQKNIEKTKKEAENHKKLSIQMQQNVEKTKEEEKNIKKKIDNMLKESARIEKELEEKLKKISQASTQAAEFQLLALKARKEKEEIKKDIEDIQSSSIEEKDEKIIIKNRSPVASSASTKYTSTKYTEPKTSENRSPRSVRKLPPLRNKNVNNEPEEVFEDPVKELILDPIQDVIKEELITNIRQGSMFDVSKLPSSVKNVKNGMTPVTVGNFSRMVPEYSKMSKELQIHFREKFRLKLEGYARIFNNIKIVDIDDPNITLEEVHVCLDVYDRHAEINLRCNQYRVALVFIWYTIQLFLWWFGISNFNLANKQMENYAEYEIVLMELSERDIGPGTLMRKESLHMRLAKTAGTGILIFCVIKVLSKWMGEDMAESSLKQIYEYFTGVSTGAINKMNIGDNIKGVSTYAAHKYTMKDPQIHPTRPGVPVPGGRPIQTDNGANVFNAVQGLANVAGTYINAKNQKNNNSNNSYNQQNNSYNQQSNYNSGDPEYDY